MTSDSSNLRAWWVRQGLNRWALKFTLRHPIMAAKAQWKWRGVPRRPITAGELLPVVEQLKDALDAENRVK